MGVSSVQSVLQQAQKTLDDANKKFPSASPTPQNPPAVHEYSAAPYGLAKELIEKKRMVDKGNQALKK
jgi:hypothetical protein